MPRWLSALLLVSLFLTACSSAPAPLPRLDESAGKPGGRLRLRLAADTPTLDPQRGTAPAAWAYAQLVTNTLARFEPDTLKLVPDLAEKWEQPDDKTLLLTLRKGVKFQKVEPANGRELEAADVKATLDRALAEGSPLREKLARIERVDAADRDAVRVVLREPWSGALAALAQPSLGILPRELVGQDDALKTQLVGTGPFLLDKRQPDASTLFRKNPDYFRPNRPFVDQVETLVIPDYSQALAAFQTEEVSFAFPSFNDLQRVQGGATKPTVTRFPLLDAAVLRFRTDRPPFGDARVRKALALAIDRDDLSKTFNGEQGGVNGPLPAALSEWAIPQDDLRGLPGYRKPKDEDIKQAKQLLKDAGVPNLRFSIQTTTAVLQQAETAYQIQAQLRAIGVEADVDLQEAPALNQSIQRGDYVAALLILPNDPDPDVTLYPRWHSKGGSNGGANLSGYANPKVDELLDAQRKETAVDKRKKDLLELQRLLIEDAPAVWLWAWTTNGAQQGYVKNMKYHPQLQAASWWLENVWLDK